MEFIKCNDCGKIYKSDLEACPQCGCPTDQRPPLPYCDESSPIDVTKIFSIHEDKFEEKKDIWILSREILRSSIEELCQTMDTAAPIIILEYHIEKSIGSLRVIYFDENFIKKLKEFQGTELWDKYGSPCKCMIINIDDRENIRLDSDESDLGIAWFSINNEEFLRCCNANKLEFKITKENGESIIVKGYYDHDLETGAEIDANGDVVPENELILNFQALYNYTIDSTMFPDALWRRHMYDEFIKQKNASEEEKVVKKNEVEKKINKGATLVICGIVITFYGLLVMICDIIFDEGPGPAFVIGAGMLTVGVPLIIWGAIRTRKGKVSKKLLKATKRTKH